MPTRLLNARHLTVKLRRRIDPPFIDERRQRDRDNDARDVVGGDERHRHLKRERNQAHFRKTARRIGENDPGHGLRYERPDNEPDRDPDVDHPDHYGGEDNPYEVIKVIEAWESGFNDGNALKYIGRHKRKGKPIQDLKKARWYLDREIQRLERENF